MAKSKADKTAKPTSDLIFSMIRPLGSAADVQSIVEAHEAGRKINPTKGLMSKSALSDLCDQQDADRIAEKVPCSVPALYQPALVDVIDSIGARIAVAGQLSRNTSRPKDWNDNLGDWQEGFTIRPHRRCHERDVRRLVTDPKENVLTVGSRDYVVGNEETPAAMLLNPSKSGNFGVNILVGKQLALLESNKTTASALKSLVFRIANKSFTDRLDDGTKPGAEIFWTADSCIDEVGYLYRGDKKMTCDQIRAAVEKGDCKGITFKKLDAPIYGRVDVDREWYQGVKRAMNLKATADDEGATMWERMGSRTNTDHRAKVIGNLRTQCRINPVTSAYPFGFRSAQTMIGQFIAYDESDEKTYLYFVVGARLGHTLRDELHPPVYESAEVEDATAEAEATTPKATTPKADKKSKSTGKKVEPDRRTKSTKAKANKSAKSKTDSPKTDSPKTKSAPAATTVVAGSSKTEEKTEEIAETEDAKAAVAAS